MKFRSAILTSIAFLSISSFGFGGLNAQASTDFSQEQSTKEAVFSEEGLQLIKESQLEMGSDEETVDKLIENYLNGGLSDADIMDLEDAVSSDTIVENETTITTFVFPDGSRAQIKNEPVIQKKSSITPFAIEGGSCQTTTVGTECKNRLISHKLAAYGYSFYANYYINRYGAESILWVGNWNIWMAGGHYANASLRTLKPVNTNWDAEARLSAQLNLGMDAGVITRSLSLYVGNNTTGTSWNTYY